MSVGVPGTPRGVGEGAARATARGRWRRALKPGIDVATKGFAVDQTFFDQTDAAKAMLGDFGGDVGAVPRQGRHAARRGHDDPQPRAGARRTGCSRRRGATKGFYSGALAKAIVDAVTKPPLRKGLHAREAPRRDDPRRPQALPRQGPRAHEGAVPGRRRVRHGPAVQRRHDGRRGAEHPHRDPGRPDVGYLGAIPRDRALHFYLEASRYAYADRNQYVGDPSFYPVPTAGLLDRDYAAQRASLIGEQAANPAVVAGRRAARRVQPWRRARRRVGSTTNMTITDKQGKVVEYTFTIEQTGGNGMVVPTTASCSTTSSPTSTCRPTAPARAAPTSSTGGKRPRSSISPTIALQNGGPFIALGSPGGATIITTVLQTLVNRLDFPYRCPTRSPRRA